MDEHANSERLLPQSTRKNELNVTIKLVTRYCDLLVVPWFLDVAVLLTYLVARAGTLCIPFALMLLGRKAGPRLVHLVHAKDQGPFRAAAARINLGYMMVCGGVALLVMLVMSQIYADFGMSDPAMKDILVWLVIGQSTPVLFGATALLMEAVNRGTFHELLQGVTASMYFVGALVLGKGDAILLAQTFAAAQLTQAALCGLLLTQCGIWPGIVALFHKEIRQF